VLLAAFLILAGVVLLYFGGELLVNCSIKLARSFNVSNMVIGLTVVAFGTSCPELAASLTAALRGSSDIAVGNVFGSNVANIGLILGISALLMPFKATVGFLRREVAFMLVATVLVYPLMVGGRLTRVEGLFLFVLLLGFLFVLLRDPGAQEESMIPDEDENEDAKGRPTYLLVLGVAVGIGLLVGGAQMLISGASDIARSLGVSERVIGFTLVALGTSLPELAASVVAVRKGEGDLVLGNLVGSNIFNLLCILGLTAMVVPIPVSPESMQLDFAVMLGTSLLMAGFLMTRLKLTRFEGAVLLTSYVSYMGYLGYTDLFGA
jgi:cation:H+ antiporter